MNSAPITEIPARRIAILGSTGSIGRSALDVVRNYPGLFEVVALAAHSNIEVLARQIAEFRPAYVAVAEEHAAKRLQAMELPATIWGGASAVEAVASIGVDTALCAMVGAVGLRPVLAAIEAGNRVAVANKEPLVMAGRLIMERAALRHAEVLPVDSEHNAIFQCLQGHAPTDVRCVHLTASGGPFYGRNPESLNDVSPEEAANHPTWKMGRKISVDSATLMNKGLEIIEAMWLFGLPEHRIEVIIHPQSVIHSLVEFNDGSILAHLGVTDMKLPILFALTYPHRVQSPMSRLELASLAGLSFAAPDFRAFPCLGLAREAAAQGGTAPAVLNAANEVAVEAFCERRISFVQISEVVRETRNRCPVSESYDLASILEIDREARTMARRMADRLTTQARAPR